MSEKQDHRASAFDLTNAVGIVSLPIIVWHGCMMRDANLESRAANELNAKQFAAAELHLKEERQLEIEARRSEGRPILLVTGPLLYWKSDQNPESAYLEIANAGGAGAIDVQVEWRVGLLPNLCRMADKSFMKPGEVIRFEKVPVPYIRDELQNSPKGTPVVGELIVRCQSIENEIIETIHEIECGRFDNGSIYVRFQGRIFRHFDDLNAWRKQWGPWINERIEKAKAAREQEHKAVPLD